MMRLCVGADNSTTIGKWFDESSRISHIWMKKHDLFAKVAERPIKKPTCEWQAIWQPQVTVQHPLRSSVNLFEDLFSGTVVLLSTREAKPFYNPVQTGEKPLYDTALGGLMFLLAHEICDINKSTVYQPHEVIALLIKGKYVIAGTPVSDADMVSDTLESFEPFINLMLRGVRFSCQGDLFLLCLLIYLTENRRLFLIENQKKDFLVDSWIHLKMQLSMLLSTMLSLIPRLISPTASGLEKLIVPPRNSLEQPID